MSTESDEQALCHCLGNYKLLLPELKILFSNPMQRVCLPLINACIHVTNSKCKITRLTHMLCILSRLNYVSSEVRTTVIIFKLSHIAKDKNCLNLMKSFTARPEKQNQKVAATIKIPRSK